VLLHSVARRLGFSRSAALVATALFSFSPLAIALHRQVFLDNVAVTWILAAFFLALSPGRHLWIQGMAGVAAAGAVLSKETVILTVPAVAYALTFLSLLWVDVTHALCQAVLCNWDLDRFYVGVGGAGMMDTLFVVPLMTAAFVAFVGAQFRRQGVRLQEI